VIEKLRQKEDSMMLRIRQAECTQTIGDLRQKIAELEVKNQELITCGQIMDDRDLQEKVVELQDEVMCLRLIQTIQRRQSISTEHTRVDYEESEDESLPSSPFSSENHHLSSSTGVYSNSILEPNHHRRQSTPSLFHSTKTQCTNSSTKPSSSQSVE